MVYKNSSQEKTGKVQRRHFMKRFSAALGIVAVFEFLGIGVGFFNSKPRKVQAEPGDRLVEAGSVSDFKPGSVTAFAGSRFFLVRLRDGGFLALSIRCSHLGCSVNWHEDKDRFICPCHSSQFDNTGNVLNPPAPRALDYYALEINGDKIFVNTTRVLKRNTFEKSQAVYA